MEKDTARLLVQALREVADDLRSTAQSRGGGEYTASPMTQADVERTIAEAFQSVIDAVEQWA